MNDIAKFDAAYDSALTTIQMATSTDEVIQARDRALALKEAARIAKDREYETKAANLVETAEAKLGELMRKQKDAGLMNKGGAEPGVGRRGAECGVTETPHSKPTLASAGIDKNLAKKARKAHAARIGETPTPKPKPFVSAKRGDDKRHKVDTLTGEVLTRTKAVKRQARAEADEEIAALKAENEKLKAEIEYPDFDRLRRLDAQGQWVQRLTTDEDTYKLFQRALHPDSRRSLSDELSNQAWLAFQELELVLWEKVGEPMPRTLDEPHAHAARHREREKEKQEAQAPDSP